jgi:hypothetical protein
MKKELTEILGSSLVTALFIMALVLCGALGSNADNYYKKKKDDDDEHT